MKIKIDNYIQEKIIKSWLANRIDYYGETGDSDTVIHLSREHRNLYPEDFAESIYIRGPIKTTIFSDSVFSDVVTVEC